MIESGEHAPDFTLPDHDGSRGQALRAARAQIVLSFPPGRRCGGGGDGVVLRSDSKPDVA